MFGSEVKSVHQEDGSLPPRVEPTESSTARQVFKLLFCTAGLQVRGPVHVCVAISLWEEEVGSTFVTISSLKTKGAVLSLIRAGLEAETKHLSQGSPPAVSSLRAVEVVSSGLGPPVHLIVVLCSHE